ncbi:MAG: hypothetical protein ACLGIA_04335 [Actinomycetes bacterium]
MHKNARRSFGYRVYRQLKKIFGPAQLGLMGEPRRRVKNRWQGVEGQWVLRRNSERRTYLASGPRGPQQPQQRPQMGPDDEQGQQTASS